jgi:amino acid permease
MLKLTYLLISIASLIFCLASAVLVFLGKTNMENYKQLFLLGSISYIIFATIWTTREEPGHDKSALSKKP